MKIKLQITLVNSLIGHPEKHRKILRSIGLTKLNKKMILEDSSSARGIYELVSHLTKIEELKDETA